MNRRSFLSSFDPYFFPTLRNKPLSPPETIQRPTSTLATQSSWGEEEAKHLIRRATFGASKKLVAHVQSLGLNGAVAKLLANLSDPFPPQNEDEDNLSSPTDSWTTKAFIDGDMNGKRLNSLRAWWIGLMLEQDTSKSEGFNIREKMTLFWHNHFVTESGIVDEARYCYQYNALLRKQATGNYRTLLEEITVNPAMLKYLNGDSNTAFNPNENYGRELLELFSIGKGQQTADPVGDYTYYNENDVKASTRVLTGWRHQVTNNVPTAYFTPQYHDQKTKIFSARFKNYTIQPQGDVEYKELVNMILTQSEDPLASAKFICRRIYRYFVYYQIDEFTEKNIITPLAQTLFNSNYEFKPVLQQLFMSQHFYDVLNRGCVIKNPIDYVVGLGKEFELMTTGSVDTPGDKYKAWFKLYEEAMQMQLALLDPPGVSGWAAYGQQPAYHEYWINSDTMYQRKGFTDHIITGLDANGLMLSINTLAFLKKNFTQADLSNARVMIDKVTQFLLPVVLPLTQEQKDTLLFEALLMGLSNDPNYWTNHWTDYTSNGATTEITKMLKSFFTYLLAMPEYHLS
ncbi:DUF1800 domain-containing protein [Solitalea sp. MAHUQ-68]|uniref:DUF1800 domain-containing protein n=1 Tax=Solitalea agri TaxID=2953739 RepID=A0A9X2F2Y6_9SPHI|nr:DUF1800 domain-containing protein [Solitalea agri]MCO4293667.1 DUF1800 domain-containing protein [Solitalea agri]